MTPPLSSQVYFLFLCETWTVFYFCLVFWSLFFLFLFNWASTFLLNFGLVFVFLLIFFSFQFFSFHLFFSLFNSICFSFQFWSTFLFFLFNSDFLFFFFFDYHSQFLIILCLVSYSCCFVSFYILFLPLVLWPFFRFFFLQSWQ